MIDECDSREWIIEDERDALNDLISKIEIYTADDCPICVLSALYNWFKCYMTLLNLIKYVMFFDYRKLILKTCGIRANTPYEY